MLEGLVKEATLYGEGSSHSARVAAWAHVGKHLGLFPDKVEHSGKDGEPIQIQRVEIILDSRVVGDRVPLTDGTSEDSIRSLPAALDNGHRETP